MTQQPAPSRIHIAWIKYEEVKIPVVLCPTCGVRRRLLACFRLWYGWDITCLTCGERWADGQMAERPFSRGWRQESVAAAREIWKRWKSAGGKAL